MAKIKNIFKKKWVRIVLIVILVALIVICALFFVNRSKRKNAISDFSYTRTITLGYSNLEETIVASGTIESQTASTITSSVTNATVAKINYDVGDYVNEGDVIIELDTTNLSKQITKASESVTKQKEQLQDNYDDAADNYYEIDDEYDDAKAAKNTAEAAYTKAAEAIKTYQEKFNNAEATYNTYINAKLATGVDIEEFKKTDEYRNATEVLEYTTAKNNLEVAKQTSNYDALQKAYESAYQTYSNLKNQRSQAESSLENAQEKLDDGVDTDQLEDLYDTVADYKIKAKSSGQITNINAVLGSSANGTLATIQDTSKLKISLTIDEYDILKLELGMKAKIETDASDNVYDGVVSVISPVATSSMGSSGFEIEVDVTSEDVKDLLIGMNAEVTIILSSGDENFTVPMDAVEEKEDGTKVIYVQNESGDFEELEVTTGENNGYYVEIFGDELKVGTVVRASADASEAEVTITEDEIEESGFNLFGGGGMPTGGGNMPSGGGGNMPSGGGGMPSGGPGGFN